MKKKLGLKRFADLVRYAYEEGVIRSRSVVDQPDEE
jgi:hypothetical protein